MDLKYFTWKDTCVQLCPAEFKLCFETHWTECCISTFTSEALETEHRLTRKATALAQHTCSPLHRCLVILPILMIILKSLNYISLSGLSFRMGLHCGLFEFSKIGILTPQILKIVKSTTSNTVVFISTQSIVVIRITKLKKASSKNQIFQGK